MASIVMTVLIPVLLYAIQLVARVFSGKNQKEAFRKAEAEQKASENKENKTGRRK
jgi:Na+-transporting methylmalonyl-CoA/oxaloacetate decarboxylase gamma subunit